MHCAACGVTALVTDRCGCGARRPSWSARWLITAQSPPLAVLAVVQLAHGLTFGLTQIGTMGLIAHRVPGHIMARGQGYLVACTGIITSTASITCGALYGSYGQGVYYLMAAMAA